MSIALPDLDLRVLEELDFDTPPLCELPAVAAWRATHSPAVEREAVGRIRRLPCGHTTALCTDCYRAWMVGMTPGETIVIHRDGVPVRVITASCALCDEDIQDARWEPLK